MKIKTFTVSSIIIILFIVPAFLKAQEGLKPTIKDTTHSLAVKKERPQKRNYLFYQPDPAYRLWQQYDLSKRANSGDPRAQHELGLRNLLGEEMPIDTLKGAFWLKKAADQDYPPALFNYGILLFNGWGVKWDPYKAFNLFARSAKENVPQAQLLLGLLYTDDLVTPKDLKEAYKWVKKSADNGYEPAKEYIIKLNKRLPISARDTIEKHDSHTTLKNSNSMQQVNSGLVYIDFDTQSDSVSDVTYDDLIEDILNSNNKVLAGSIKKNKDSIYYFDETMINVLNESSDYGCPEAVALKGWMYENGKVFHTSLIQALNYYARGAANESRRSMMRLWALVNKNGVMQTLKDSADVGNVTALISWYQIYKLKLDRRISDQDALNLLNKALSKNDPLALVEAGLNYYSGIFVNADRQKGMEAWLRASELGNTEAKIRIEISRLLGETEAADLSESLQFLITASEKGSVLSEAALASFYYQQEDFSKAVYYLRSAAMRGSSYAYNRLKSIYEEIKTKNE